MPKQVLFQSKAFEAFTQALTKRGFRKIGGEEHMRECVRLGLQAPRRRPGREVGFTFTANGLTVVVWTTFVEAEGRPRDVDAGWVLIKEGDAVKYFSHPLHRTERFLYRLLEQAAIARTRVVNRPLCPLCQKFMRITEGRGLKSRYWSCRDHTPGEYQHLPWDHELPSLVRERVERIRKGRESYTKKLKKEGRKRGAAQRARQPWSMDRPANMVT